MIEYIVLSMKSGLMIAGVGFSAVCSQLISRRIWRILSNMKRCNIPWQGTILSVWM